MEQLRFRFGRPEQLIRSQLNSVREVPPISEQHLARIVPFATRVSNLTAFLQSTKAEQHLRNPTRMEELVAKLPTSKRVDWARHAASIEPFPTVAHFSVWLQEYANVVCTVLDVEGKEPRRRVLHASVDQYGCDQQDDRHGGCPICGGQHAATSCREFIGASPPGRWSMVRRHRLCFTCLRSGHTTRTCDVHGECQINGCRRLHHRLLHGADEERRWPAQRGGFRSHNGGNQQSAVSRRGPDRRSSPRGGYRDHEGSLQSAVPRNSLEIRAPQPAEAPVQRNLNCVDAEGGRLLFRILPVTLYGAGRQVDTYALLDEGSSVTMIDDELRRNLGVRGVHRQLNIQWFGGRASREPSNVVSLEISGAGKPTRHALRNVYSVSSLSLPMQTLGRRDVQGVHKDARLPMKPYINVVPKLLIGLDHGHLGLPLRTRRFAREGPYAAATELGWVVFGPVSGQSTTPSPRPCLLAVSMDDTMEKMVEDYFEMESFGVKLAPQVAGSDDARAQRSLEDTTVKVGRRYQTGLLWKDDYAVLPRSYEMAHRRLINVEKKLKRNGQLALEYDRIIKDYVSKGYARKLQQDEVAVTSDRLWYLPHFGVENPNKPGKVRLVFDAAAKVGGTSLNSALDKGPQHYKPLPAVLFHFREGAVGVCGDIKEMFHQVLIRPEDRCSQRFLWRDGNDDRDPDTYEDDNVMVSFVCAKTKCAPMRTMSIPRLELQAAVLGTRLMNTVQEEHSVDISETVLWTDSKTVLRWIGSTHRRYKQFVGNRVAEILESSKVSQWRWVPTADNAADDATRSQNKADLSPESRWLSGPAFLRQPASGWPAPEEGTKRVPDAPDEEEMPGEFALVAADEFATPFQRFSSFSRLVRTTAWVSRFARWCRKQRSEIEEYGLTASECEATENLLVRQAQLESFPDEMRSAGCGKDVASSSEIRGLAPYVDEHGVLRVYGRVDAALCMPYSARRPVILSHRHSLTDLIVRHFHAQMKHQNVDATIAQIRTRFWVTKMRRVLKEVISSCNECKLQRTRPMPSIMGPLPEDRLEAGGWPFKYTGLDYFGPLLVTVSRHREKRWVALFTCLTTRAIHLELAHDLSTDSCIIAMRNFVCRRGPVHRLRSDNGKNFVGADREAKRFGDVFETERIQSELSSRSIEWGFNCPSNPSEGGVWERMVQCVKRVLRHTLKEVAPRDHVLESFLIEAENVVNSRPLTHLPVDADQEAPLTPNDLLKGAANLPNTPGLDAELPKEGSTRKQWRIARMLRDRFWRRWVLEYLPTLVRREKWCRRTEPIRQGDMVFVCDPALPRREWRKGIVEEVYSGADGVVRRATVRVNDNGLSRTMLRPVSKLAVLDLSEAVLHGVGDVDGRTL
ncbi:uncharacterized protein [Drosophila suzukii]|uniref:Integrase catalytic domain-containing protein n=1 Tax=Drosophila suzukii TaxID=28584 RepID=A0ABM4TYZ2_DROSZ